MPLWRFCAFFNHFSKQLNLFLPHVASLGLLPQLLPSVCVVQRRRIHPRHAWHGVQRLAAEPTHCACQGAFHPARLRRFFFFFLPHVRRSQSLHTFWRRFSRGTSRRPLASASWIACSILASPGFLAPVPTAAFFSTHNLSVPSSDVVSFNRPNKFSFNALRLLGSPRFAQ